MTNSTVTVPTVTIEGPQGAAEAEILTPQALEFLGALAATSRQSGSALLAARVARAEALRKGQLYDFLPETASVRQSEWRVAPIPADLQDRRTEITGPVDRKMVINALNSGANVFMADFEDSTSPTWRNVIDGQVNLRDAIRREISFASPEGKQYKLNEKTATLFVRPRGWHLPEKHLLVQGQPISRLALRFRLVLLSQRRGPESTRHRLLTFTCPNGEPSRSALVEQRLQLRAGCAGHSPRHHSRHRAHRDAARGL
jgi:malate synthase